MKKRLIYEDENGYCRIIVPSERFQQVNESEESAVGRLYSRVLPRSAEFIVCDPDLIPEDLSFRDAWKKGTPENPIQIDMQKSMEIHRKRIQGACERKIEQLEKDLEVALERENLAQATAIRRTKKILREIPEKINLTHCKTPSDIKYSIPKELQDVWTHYNPVP